MCGFVGFRAIKDFERLSEVLPGAMSSLTHRGPDDSGLFFDSKAGIGLGHRRLSVIDLSAAGRQPMASDDGRVQIVCNADVCNLLEFLASFIFATK